MFQAGCVFFFFLDLVPLTMSLMHLSGLGDYLNEELTPNFTL